MRRLVVSRAVQRSSLYVLLFLLPFSKAAIEIAFFVLLVGWLLEHVPTGWSTSVWRTPQGQRCLIALLAYLGVCALSVLTSSHPDLSLRGLIRKTLEYALFFVMVADVASDPVVAKRCLFVVMGSALFVGLDAVAQEVIGKDPLLGHHLFVYGRMTGPYENPIDLATYLMVVIPVVLVKMVEPHARGKWILGVLALLLVGSLVRTGSQGAWVGFLGGLALLFVLARRMRRLVLIGCLGLGAIALFLQTTGRSPNIFEFSDVGTQDRLFMWQAAWRMIEDRPIIGHGLNTFMANYLTYWVGGERQPRYAHNCYLQIWAETGLLGLGTFLVLIWCTVGLWLRAMRGMPEGPNRLMLLGLTAGLVAFLVQSAFDTNFYALRQAVLFWVLAGFALGFSERVQAPARPS